MKLNYKRTIFTGLAFLSICAFWQLYDNIVPLILKHTFSIQETMTGVIMAMDNVLALFLLPFFGALSDGTETRFGKRMPFICAGTLCSAVLLTLLPLTDRSQSLPLFILCLFFLLLCMGTYRSPAVALMPDLTPKPLRSQANAIINLMGAVGGVFTLVMIKCLVSEETRPDYLPLFLSVAILMLLSVAVLVLVIKENRLRREADAQNAQYEKLAGEWQANHSAIAASGQSTGTAQTETTQAPATPLTKTNQSLDTVHTEANQALATPLTEASQSISTAQTEANQALATPQTEASQPAAQSKAVTPQVRSDINSSKETTERSAKNAGSLPDGIRRSLIFLLASVALWYMAYNAVISAFSRYAVEVWGLHGGGFADAILITTAAAIISYLPIGLLSNRFGRKRVILVGVCGLFIGFCFASLFSSYSALINIIFALVGVSWAAVNVNSYPMVVEMSAGQDVGKFTGYYYTFSMAAQIATPILSGFLLQYVSYRTLFPYAAFFSAAAFVTMLFVKHGDVKQTGASVIH